MEYRFTKDNFHPTPPPPVARGLGRTLVDALQLALAVIVFCSMVDVAESIAAGHFLNASANAGVIALLLWLGRR